MKAHLPILLFALAFSACKKEPLNGGSTPVNFKSTEYSSPGGYDAQGKPDYLVQADVVKQEVLDFAKTNLPETGDVSKAHPEFLKNADLAITARSEVYVTFVSEGTGFLNTVGYYLFPTNNPPTKPENLGKITYIFPNASRTGDGGSLNPGDKVKLGVVEAGMSVGFVLLKDAWNPMTRTINTKAPHFLSNKQLNPENREELKAHTVLIEYPADNKVLIGFEDINRTQTDCDHDFNDVLMYATVKAL